MAHALLAVSKASKRLAAPSVSSNNDDGFSSLASNNNSAHLRHQSSIASTSSTLYTCSEEDEQSIPDEDERPAIDSAACDEVIQDSRLNGAGLPIPWYSHSIEASTSSSNSNKSKERAANHAMRFKRKKGSSRASLETLGQDWHPRAASSSVEAPHSQSPSKGSSSSCGSSPRKMSQSSCTCHVDEVSSSRAEETLEEKMEELMSIDDQLDKMIKMTSDLLRVSKGVLASSKRVSVTKASESQVG